MKLSTSNYVFKRKPSSWDLIEVNEQISVDLGIKWQNIKSCKQFTWSPFGKTYQLKCIFLG